MKTYKLTQEELTLLLTGVLCDGMTLALDEFNCGLDASAIKDVHDDMKAQVDDVYVQRCLTNTRSELANPKTQEHEDNKN